VRDGPPPVPGGRSPEEREAARQAREARRAARGGRTHAPVSPDREPPRDWLAEAEDLTTPAPGPDGDGDDRVPAGGAGGTRLPRRRSHSGGGTRPRWGRLVALAIVAVLVLGVAWVANSLFQPFKGEGEGSVRVVIPEGASLSEIADLLEQRGVISSASFFELRARLSGRSGDLKPGRYELANDMRYATVLDRLEQGLPPNIVQVTVPEGRSRREVAPLVRGLRGNYVRATRRNAALNPREYRAEDARSLEGFLFPATYELKKGASARRLVRHQLEAFKRNFDEVDLRYARRRNLTPYDVLIIASLVEREAAVAKERPLIASVIYNRLKNDLRLDIDATTRFAVGNWRSPLKQSELQNQSPYNTRVHAGLPPGPIGSPGLASIKAAAQPARTGLLFYVVKPGTCNRHNFAETDAEFQRYVDEYNRARDERGGKSPTTC
jgi:UPF0755 protein